MSVSLAGHKKEAVFSQDGPWEIELEAMEYGGPYTLELLLDGTPYTLHDVMIGEVLLCAGQSNMQFMVKEENIENPVYAENSMVRAFVVDRPEENEGLKTCDGWVPATENTIPRWSAIGYHMGEYLQKKRGIAIGIIGCYQGASVIQSWMPERLFTSPKLCVPKEELFMDHTNQFSAWNGFGTLYHGMFEKFLPFSVGHVVWYQGESNTSLAEGQIYDELLTTLIHTWREDLRWEMLPFILVQICDFDERKDEGWKLVQSAQEKTAKQVPYTIMVESRDVCEHAHIHPEDKRQLSQKIAEATGI